MTTQPSPAPLVLITGANGFIGFAVLKYALKSGYRVRAAVRRQQSIDVISSVESVQEFVKNGALTFELVADMMDSTAYDKAVKGVDYIIHIASPTASVAGDLPKMAAKGNESILLAAEKEPNVKRVVITASVVAIRPWDRSFKDHPLNVAVASGKDEDVPPVSGDSEVPTPAPLDGSEAPFQRYANSKVTSHNFVLDYVRTKNPHFSVVNVMPGWTFGKNELVKTKEEAFSSSNRMMSWLFTDFKPNAMFNVDAMEDFPMLAETVHIDDVAEAHVKALDEVKVTGKLNNYMVAGNAPNGPVFEDAISIIKKELPEEAKLVPFTGKLNTIKAKIDTSATERDLFGRPVAPFSKQVVDLVRWVVTLPDQ